MYILVNRFLGPSSGHHLCSFQLFESTNAAVCSHLCFSSLDPLLSVSSQGCVSHSLHYLFFFAEGICSCTATAGTFVIFGRVLPALCFGWQKLCGSLARQLGWISIAPAPCVVPGCSLDPFSLKSCCLCWPNSEQFPQLFPKIPLFQSGSWTCVFNTEQEQRGGSQPY